MSPELMNPRATFEALARYAAGVGLEVDVVVRERAPAQRRPTADGDEMLVIRAADLDQVLAKIHGHIDALRDSAHGTDAVASGAE